MRHRLIGITGRAGSGKNAVAAMIPRATVVQLADPLYEMLAVMLGTDVDDLRIRSIKEREIPWLGKSPRQLLQTLGTEWGRERVADDVWIRILARRIKPLRHQCVVAVADIRFDNEAEFIRQQDGEVWHVRRPGLEAGTHISEAGVTVAESDVVIENDGTLGDLKEKVAAAYLGEASCPS
jgi:hypothetical protein